MKTFTSTLPEYLFEQLLSSAESFPPPKNKIIEKALRIYLDQLKRATYPRSYKKMSDDTDIIIIAEEGMADYMK